MRSISATAIRMCRLALLPLVLCSVTGCGRDNPFDLVKVSGTLTYDDGTLIPANMIILKFEPLAAPLDTKTHPPSGMSYVNVSDGTFDVVTSYKYADGLVSRQTSCSGVGDNSIGRFDEAGPGRVRRFGPHPSARRYGGVAIPARRAETIAPLAAVGGSWAIRHVAAIEHLVTHCAVRPFGPTFLAFGDFSVPKSSLKRILLYYRGFVVVLAQRGLTVLASRWTLRMHEPAFLYDD